MTEGFNFYTLNLDLLGRTLLGKFLGRLGGFLAFHNTHSLRSAGGMPEHEDSGSEYHDDIDGDEQRYLDPPINPILKVRKRRRRRYQSSHYNTPFC